MAEHSSGGRKEFNKNVRSAVARKAMYICSNPTCLRVTGFQTEKGDARAIAQVAHIVAAAQNGPRAGMTLPDRTQIPVDDERNALWLCTPCHQQIDADASRYPVSRLLEWKEQHEDRVSNLVNLDLEQALLRLGATRRYHDIVRDLLYWLDDRRFMYFEDEREFPDQVFESVQAFRGKVRGLQAQMHSGPREVTNALNDLSRRIQAFLREISDLDMYNITVTSGDPDFERFSAALARLRTEVKNIIKPLDPDFDFQRITFL